MIQGEKGHPQPKIEIEIRFVLREDVKNIYSGISVLRTTLKHEITCPKMSFTRLSSIESQPKKVVVVVVFVVIIIVGHKNLTLKFGPNWVNNKCSCFIPETFQ